MTPPSRPDIDHLRSWIGSRLEARDAVTPDLVRKFRAMLSLPSGEPAIGEPVPPLLHFCLAQPVAATAALGADGHPERGGFLPPVPLTNRMWAGGDVTFHDELRTGDEVLRVSTVRDVTLKDGRSGLLCFVTVDHEISVSGETRISERQDIVYRPPSSGATPVTPAKNPETPTLVHMAEATPTLLFRYSALTFNSHRIHYDYPYATGVEGYPGLVVHGPLQATMLACLAADHRKATPHRFSFRGLSPLFAGNTLSLNAAPAGEALKLWTEKDDGTTAMVAEAVWK